MQVTEIEENKLVKWVLHSGSVNIDTSSPRVAQLLKLVTDSDCSLQAHSCFQSWKFNAVCVNDFPSGTRGW